MTGAFPFPTAGPAPRCAVRRRAVAAALALLAVVLPRCAQEQAGAELPVESIVVGNHRVTVELAATAEARRRGLMFRESLPADHGMLFLYPREQRLTFWMKDTPLPLSIAFADAGGRIVRIADMEPHSEAPVSSGAPARYALEMRRGWFERNGVFVGDHIGRIPHVPVE